MIRTTPVTQIMSKKVIALNTTDDLNRAEMLFKKYRIRHIPVVSKGSVIGMLSYTDLLRSSFSDTTDDDQNLESIVYNTFSIEQVMTKKVICISNTTTIKEAAEILAKKEFHALPVIDEDSVLVGIVTTTDLINYTIKQF